MEKVYRAGVICYTITEVEEVEMLFMKPTPIQAEYQPDGYDTFQIPKGRVEPGETKEQAALREAQEEVGLFRGNIIGEPHHLGTFLGRTDIYLCKIMDKDMFGEPSNETEDVKWMTLSEFLDVGRTLHQPIVSAANRWIEKSEGLI